MNQIAINSKLTLFNLNVGYNITGTHSNFGNVFKRKSDLNMFYQSIAHIEFPNIDERKKQKFPEFKKVLSFQDIIENQKYQNAYI
jgi:hypothetical protein